jgi:hypothetical protein
LDRYTEAKDGDEKLAAWNNFQRFCFVISTLRFQVTTLPPAAVGEEGGAEGV